MTDLTSSYRIDKMEVKLEGVTTDGRHVQEVLTIGKKPVTSKHIYPRSMPPHMTIQGPSRVAGTINVRRKMG